MIFLFNWVNQVYETCVAQPRFKKVGAKILRQNGLAAWWSGKNIHRIWENCLSWWFQLISKISVDLDHLPRCKNKKHWNRQPGIYLYCHIWLGVTSLQFHGIFPLPLGRIETLRKNTTFVHGHIHPDDYKQQASNCNSSACLRATAWICWFDAWNKVPKIFSQMV